MAARISNSGSLGTLLPSERYIGFAGSVQLYKWEEKIYFTSLIYHISQVFLPHFQNQTTFLPELTKPVQIFTRPGFNVGFVQLSATSVFVRWALSHLGYLTKRKKTQGTRVTKFPHPLPVETLEVAGKAVAAVVAGKVTTTIVAGKAMLVTAREGFGLVATWCMHTVIGAPSKV
jgi:hypothetical protein